MITIADNSAERLLLLCLDGVPFELAREIFPCAKKLETVVPYITVPVWPSILTGRKPEELKLYGLRKLENQVFRKVNFQDFSFSWDFLFTKFRKICIYGVPFSRFCETSSFLSLPCFLAGKEVCVFQTQFGKIQYRPDIGYASKDEILDFILLHLGNLVFLSQFYDCVIAELIGTDRFLHFYWDDKDELINILEAFLIPLLSMFPFRLIFSDHGMQPSSGYFDFKKWAFERGFQQLKGLGGYALRLFLGNEDREAFLELQKEGFELFQFSEEDFPSLIGYFPGQILFEESYRPWVVAVHSEDAFVTGCLVEEPTSVLEFRRFLFA